MTATRSNRNAVSSISVGERFDATQGAPVLPLEPTTTKHKDGSSYSADCFYRWSFSLRWSDGDVVAWVGLNPGTGDTTGKPRRTLKKMVKWSKKWGYGGLIIVNIFAWRGTDPEDLEEANDSGWDVIGTDNNDQAIRAAITQASLTVACWGNWNSKIRKGERGKTVALMLKDAKCLGLTKRGEPRHPLYVKYSNFVDQDDLQPFPVPPMEPKPSATIETRITGAMLGLACGDALGAPAEFKDKAYVQQKWGTLTEMVGGGVWKPGEWTDDTGMALCIAEGILANPDDPVEETGKRFLEWRKSAKDVGSTISAALSACKGDWPAAAKSTPQANAGKAAGNGSLMRTLPVALAYAPGRVPMLAIAARLSAMTHWDGEAEACCIIYCVWITSILEGQSLQHAWHEALTEAREVAGHGQYLPDAPGRANTFSTGLWDRLKAVEALTYDRLQPSGYAGYAVECLEAAAWCCLKSGSLEQALVRAVNLAGEADTIAAVAGGAAGAYWGSEAIPQRWLDKLHKRADLELTAKRLAVLRRHHQVYSAKGLPAFNNNWVTDQIMAGRNPLTCRDVEKLADYGITNILDLRVPKEWTLPKVGAEAIEEIERRGLQRHHVQVRDTREPTGEALDDAYCFLGNALKNENNSVYVHCRAGNERTAAILIAYYARHHGVCYDDALATLRKGRPTFTPLPGQEQAVRQWLRHTDPATRSPTS